MSLLTDNQLNFSPENQIQERHQKALSQAESWKTLLQISFLWYVCIYVVWFRD